MRKTCSRIASVTLVVVATLSQSGLARADDESYKQLQAQWWQWALSIPAARSPVDDTTGADCMIGQRGDNWFLAGTGGGSVVRNCAVPEGVTLFFPVINAINVDTPGQCGQGPDPLPVSLYRSLSAQFVDGASNLSVTLDGKPSGPMHRTQSKVFAIALPTDNVFAFCLLGGIYALAVDDGIYVRLNPPSIGAHTLRFHAENPSAGFVLDVTYHLDVVPVVRK